MYTPPVITFSDLIHGERGSSAFFPTDGDSRPCDLHVCVHPIHLFKAMPELRCVSMFPPPFLFFPWRLPLFLGVVLAPVAFAQVTYSGEIVPVITGLSSPGIQSPLTRAATSLSPTMERAIFTKRPCPGAPIRSRRSTTGECYTIQLAEDTSGNLYAMLFEADASTSLQFVGRKHCRDYLSPGDRGE